MGIILTEKGVQSGCATFLAKSTNLSAYRLKELESLFERAFPNVKGIEQLEDAIEGEQTTETALARLFEDNPTHTPQPRLSEDHFSTFATALGWRESASGFCSYADIGEIM